MRDVDMDWLKKLIVGVLGLFGLSTILQCEKIKGSEGIEKEL
jgi:hypothetical protein